MSEVAVEHVAHLDVVDIRRFADAKREVIHGGVVGEYVVK